MIRYFIDSPAAPGFDLSFEQKSAGASGYDLHANIGSTRVIGPGRRFTISSGIYVAMEPGIEAHIRPRSGLVRDQGVMCAFGSVDSDYRGEIGVTLFNLGHDDYHIVPGERIAQLVFTPVLPAFMGLVWAMFHTNVTQQPVTGHVVFPGLPPPVTVLSFWPRRVFDKSELGSTDRGTSGFGSTGR